jgi:hypothetical protein
MDGEVLLLTFALGFFVGCLLAEVSNRRRGL